MADGAGGYDALDRFDELELDVGESGAEVKVLVTGSAGFLGSNVCRVFAQEGVEVTGYDLQILDLPSIRQVRGNLLDQSQLNSAAEGHDVICHIGAIGDVYLAAEKPSLAAAVNVTGTANVAAAAKHAHARVVYASTWEVYGDPVYEPIDEDHPCNPDHPYNITKLAGERMLLASDKLENVPALALRLGTAYGPGMRPNSVFEIFIRQAMEGEPLTIQGDGSQGRQFTHATDIARAFLLASRSKLRGLAINIVATEMISIKQLAERVAERFPTDVRYGEPRPGDVTSAYVSGARGKELLGWTAEIEFDQGMDQLLSADRS